MVTVEAAIALASVVAVLAMAVGGIGAILAQISAVDAAREAARSAAVSGTEAGVAAGERVLDGRSGEVRISGAGDEPAQAGSVIVATVDVPAPGLPQSLGLELSATAAASVEPGAAP
ncbi:TadE family type IV pilus minor pilin [Dietzia sp.]|uniref:TadE family type IV pilus minor pilin n=1 Tax=Dietzia sp. TaxID=1871616 RepID=UPI002FD9CC4C